jgi:hypothetical protein
LDPQKYSWSFDSRRIADKSIDIIHATACFLNIAEEISTFKKEAGFQTSCRHLNATRGNNSGVPTEMRDPCSRGRRHATFVVDDTRGLLARPITYAPKLASRTPGPLAYAIQ